MAQTAQKIKKRVGQTKAAIAGDWEQVAGKNKIDWNSIADFAGHFVIAVRDPMPQPDDFRGKNKAVNWTALDEAMAEWELRNPDIDVTAHQDFLDKLKK